MRGLWSERVSRNCNWRVCLSCRERSRSAGVVGISICLGLELRHWMFIIAVSYISFYL